MSILIGHGAHVLRGAVRALTRSTWCRSLLGPHRVQVWVVEGGVGVGNLRLLLLWLLTVRLSHNIYIFNTGLSLLCWLAKSLT